MKQYTYQMTWIVGVIAETPEEALEMLPHIWESPTYAIQDEEIDFISEEEVEA